MAGPAVCLDPLEADLNRQKRGVTHDKANGQGEEDGAEEGSGMVRAEGGRAEGGTWETAGGSERATEAGNGRGKGTLSDGSLQARPDLVV
jgi:hypothetical protein